ncbi:hypothetical protein Tco_0408505 [Tanacetum coccineum]
MHSGNQTTQPGPLENVSSVPGSEALQDFFTTCITTMNILQVSLVEHAIRSCSTTAVQVFPHLESPFVVLKQLFDVLHLQSGSTTKGLCIDHVCVLPVCICYNGLPWRLSVETVYACIVLDDREVDIIKKTENQAKMTKLSMEWKRLCKAKCQSQSQY